MAQTSRDITREAMIEKNSNNKMVVPQNKAISPSPAQLYLSSTTKEELAKTGINEITLKLVEMYLAAFSERSKEFNQHLNEIRKSYNNLNDRYAALKARQSKKNEAEKEANILQLIAKVKSGADSLETKIKEYESNSTLSRLSKDTLALISSEHLTMLYELDKSVVDITNIIFKRIKDALLLFKNEPSKEDESESKPINPLIKPAFLSGTGQMRIIPSINFLATKTVAKKGQGSSLSIHVFSSPSSDTSYLGDKINFFIPQASNLGFGFDYCDNFNSVEKDDSGKYINQVAIRFSGYYLNKRVSMKDSLGAAIKDINTIGLFHICLGGEFTKGNMFTLYGNLNLIAPVNGRTTYEQFFNTNLDLISFIDFGARTDFYLDPKSTDQHIVLGLGFILINPSMKNLYPTDDYLIPTLSVSFFKSLK